MTASSSHRAANATTIAVQTTRRRLVSRVSPATHVRTCRRRSASSAAATSTAAASSWPLPKTGGIRWRPGAITLRWPSTATTAKASTASMLACTIAEIVRGARRGRRRTPASTTAASSSGASTAST